MSRYQLATIALDEEGTVGWVVYDRWFERVLPPSYTEEAEAIAWVEWLNARHADRAPWMDSA